MRSIPRYLDDLAFTPEPGRAHLEANNSAHQPSSPSSSSRGQRQPARIRPPPAKSPEPLLSLLLRNAFAPMGRRAILSSRSSSSVHKKKKRWEHQETLPQESRFSSQAKRGAEGSVAGGIQRAGGVQEDREAAGGLGNSGEGVGSGRGTAVSLSRRGSREGTRVWGAEEKGESRQTVGAEADPWMETRNSLEPRLPRGVWDTPVRNRQPEPAGVRDLEDTDTDTWAGCWAERMQRVPR